VLLAIPAVLTAQDSTDFMTPPAPAPYHPDQADLYSQNYNALYGHTDSGHTPWG